MISLLLKQQIVVQKSKVWNPILLFDPQIIAHNIFQRSIQGLNILNDLGYGVPESGLELNLVYNPLGAFLPPNQVWNLFSKY